MPSDAIARLDPLIVERLVEVVRLLVAEQITRALHLADEVAYELGMVE